MILMVLIGTLLIIFLYTMHDKKEKQISEECWHNILKSCKGKCCKKCDLESLCKIACKENPDQCGGKID
ncbi:hypothetical protein [Clostridium botulinum]|uniref:hypothetical protein n=1 Tax=Clostridium botulinum TaxID=1491 RepID=UPI00249E08F8|nr:hypothetical protein [Clostridium botulinum]WGZ48111.1 hypothetical protein HEQ52_18365 [Clostridium botulinum]